MLPLTVAEIVLATGGVLVLGDPKNLVGTGVSTDSRSLRRGDIFFAIKGVHHDAHNFLSNVVERGASACVVSRIPKEFSFPVVSTPTIIKVRDTRAGLAQCAAFYGKKYGENLTRIGISGSCGKTTVKEMIAQILTLAGPTVYSPGNFNNDIGCPLSLFRIDPSHCYGVFEIGSSAPGEVRRLSEIVSPKLAVITQIGLEHTATFGTIEQIAAGECEILESLPDNGIAVLPRDDPFYDFMVSRLSPDKKIRVVSFGFSENASVRITGHKLWPGPVSFTFSHGLSGKGSTELTGTVPVFGKFNVLNASAAAACALSLGVPGETVLEGLKNFVPPQMRFQVKELDTGVIVVNDSYNANPGSMRASLESFAASFPDRVKYAVLADMLELGEISKQEHHSLGEFAAKLPLSKILLYGPQSRFTADGARNSLVNEDQLKYCVSLTELSSELCAIVQPGCAVLLKGSRGMHLEDLMRVLMEKRV